MLNDGMEQLNAYFAENSEGWFLGSFLIESKTSMAVLIESVKTGQFQGPYRSETELRQKLKDLSLKTPWVGICVLQSMNGKLEVKQCFQASGPDFVESTWEPIQIQQ